MAKYIVDFIQTMNRSLLKQLGNLYKANLRKKAK